MNIEPRQESNHSRYSASCWSFGYDGLEDSEWCENCQEGQLKVCNTMLERKPVAMTTAAMNSTNLLPCLKKAQESGIKVVYPDGNLDENLDPKILNAE